MARLFRVFVPLSILVLLFSEAVLICGSFVLAFYIVLEDYATVALLYEGGLTRILMAAAGILVTMHFRDLYSRIQVKSRIALLQELSLVMGVAFLIQSLISYLNREWRMGVKTMVLGCTFSAIAIFLWRIFYGRFLVRVVGDQRILLVGDSALLEAVATHIQENPELGWAVAGYLDDQTDPGAMRPGGKVLGPISALRQIATQVNPDRIVVGLAERRQRMPVTDLLELRFSGIVIEEVSAAYEAVCMRTSIQELRPSHLVFSGELGPRPATLAFQAVYNLGLAALGTIVSLPLMIVVAIAIKLSSPGPILYRQTRVGQGGRDFTLYKFRSMYADAEASSGAVWAVKDDPRITPVGRFLRTFRLDELAQFLNVLAGDMSLVGPRPERPEFVKMLSEQIPYYRQRHCVKPGITGWAQINHKYGDTLEDTVTKLEYDLYYIKNLSASLDLYIIFHTLKTIVLSRGAQ